MLNRAVGLNRNHLWFFGPSQDYWDSDIQYKRPGEIEQSPGGLMRGGAEYDAIGQMARQLELAERDRLCYLFDDGDEWRFYAICKEIDETESSDKAPEVIKENGDAVEQHGPVDEAW